ncbi:coproporphyrinogen oxidase [Nannocystis exedens]|uniref:coproporphyrinogen oxidase n=1 Tax=Nannocystis exedens TaxID=54 RepID=A0A1I1WSS5_9BACT|nr:coproporphyrinogen III oxidase [Nannocystis exedens]SFD98082.1 coproporphyrinogen oxidase [Nannocystis exedens]
MVSATSFHTEFQRRAHDAVLEVQSTICAAIEALEREAGGSGTFASDAWDRPGGGGGLTRVIRGDVIEKGGVNTSAVFGELNPQFASQLAGTGANFFAAGVSLVLHPKNPFVPTVHANFRYIEQGERRWFGGGADLTPYYYFAEDKAHFHDVWRRFCDAHPGIGDYPRFSDWCDRYFYLKHRGESRGVGGIFFDHLFVDSTRPGHDDALLRFIRDGGMRFLDAWLPIARRRLPTPYGPDQRRWQELRRGRYVEFNLLYDRGTVFGLKTGGRTESILMSLPPHVQWGYAEEPAPGTPEAALLAELRKPFPGDEPSP